LRSIPKRRRDRLRRVVGCPRGVGKTHYSPGQATVGAHSQQVAPSNETFSSRRHLLDCVTSWLLLSVTMVTPSFRSTSPICRMMFRRIPGLSPVAYLLIFCSGRTTLLVSFSHLLKNTLCFSICPSVLFVPVDF